MATRKRAPVSADRKQCIRCRRTIKWADPFCFDCGRQNTAAERWADRHPVPTGDTYIPHGRVRSQNNDAARRIGG